MDGHPICDHYDHYAPLSRRQVVSPYLARLAPVAIRYQLERAPQDHLMRRRAGAGARTARRKRAQHPSNTRDSRRSRLIGSAALHRLGHRSEGYSEGTHVAHACTTLLIHF